MMKEGPNFKACSQHTENVKHIRSGMEKSFQQMLDLGSVVWLTGLHTNVQRNVLRTSFSNDFLQKLLKLLAEHKRHKQSSEFEFSNLILLFSFSSFAWNVKFCKTPVVRDIPGLPPFSIVYGPKNSWFSGENNLAHFSVQIWHRFTDVQVYLWSHCCQMCLIKSDRII